MMCRRGEDIILVTLNHLDAIRNLLGNSEVHINMLDTAIKTLADVSAYPVPLCTAGVVW